MSYDELGLDTLGDERTALFFLISDTDTTYNFIVALAFSQMFNLLCERADSKYGGRLRFGSMGYCESAGRLRGGQPGQQKPGYEAGHG